MFQRLLTDDAEYVFASVLLMDGQREAQLVPYVSWMDTLDWQPGHDATPWHLPCLVADFGSTRYYRALPYQRKLVEHGGRLLTDGTLEMRDPNDNARRRHQYRLINGQPCKRLLPARGDFDPPAAWEPLNLAALSAVTQGYNPVLDYFAYQRQGNNA